MTTLNVNSLPTLTTMNVDTFVQIPTTATPTTNDVSTKCATTAFCKNMIAGFTSANYLNDTGTQNITGSANLASSFISAIIGGVSGALIIGASSPNILFGNSTGSITFGGILQSLNTTYPRAMTTSQIAKTHIYRGVATGLITSSSTILAFGITFATAPSVFVVASGSTGVVAYVTAVSTTQFTVWSNATVVYWVALGN